MAFEKKTALIEKAMELIDNKPTLINLIARRVRQLNKNARPLVEKHESEDNITVALREIAEGKIYPVFKKKNDQNTNDE